MAEKKKKRTDETGVMDVALKEWGRAGEGRGERRGGSRAKAGAAAVAK